MGLLLSQEAAVKFMEMAPRLAMWPGVVLTVVVYCLNMFGDAVRDLLDPRLRHRRCPPRPAKGRPLG